MTTKILAIWLSSIILLIVVEFTRREKLTFKYAVGWLFLAVLSLFFSIFDQFLFTLSKWFGFILMSNFIFFILFCFFVFLSLIMTTFLCQQNSRNDALAQKVALLEMELKKIKKEG